jgi:hypothetical protein
MVVHGTVGTLFLRPVLYNRVETTQGEGSMIDRKNIVSYELVPLPEAALETRIDYQVLRYRILRGKIPAEKYGDRWFLRGDVVERLKEEKGDGQTTMDS